VFLLSCAAFGDDVNHIFSVGEKIGYQVNAANLYLGNHIVELRAIDRLDGREVYKLHGLTTASKFMNLFYKVDDKWLVFIDRARLIPLRLEKDMLEGKREAYLVYHIDQDGRHVVFENRSSGEVKEKESQHLVFDVFTLAYYYRQFPEQFDGMFTFDFLEEGGLQTVQFRNEGEVDIRVIPMAGTKKLRAYKMKQVGGIGIEIYVSTDELRLPLKIVTPAKLKRGRTLNVEMNLEKYRPGENNADIPQIYRDLSF
jgi:hypothetical protein